MLLENCGEVCLAYIVGKGAIAEDDVRFARRGQLLVPSDYAKSKWLHLGGGNVLGEAHQKRARADVMDGLSSYSLLFDGNGEVEAQLEQQLEKNVLLGAVGL